MELESYYNETYTKGQLEADLNRTNRLQFLFGAFPHGLKVLSVGCGPGVDVDFLVKGGNEVHGIDISDEALSHAQIQGIITHKIDLSQNSHLPFNESAFDIIIATDILEHLFLPERLLRELARLLRQSGILIASVPNHFFWKMRLRIMVGGDLILPFHKQSKQWDYFHIRFFTSKGFEELLDKTGFRILERHYGHFISVPKVFPSALGHKLARRYPDLFSKHFIVKAMKK